MTQQEIMEELARQARRLEEQLSGYLASAGDSGPLRAALSDAKDKTHQLLDAIQTGKPHEQHTR